MVKYIEFAEKVPAGVRVVTLVPGRKGEERKGGPQVSRPMIRRVGDR